MTENRENLQLLLKFIGKLLEQEGNEWFHDELANLISKKIISERDTEIHLAAVQIRDRGSIDKYIENGIIPIIDYSKIEDSTVKYTLERDCIEMGKCRFSHFGKNESFYEFCKYAFFQIEQMLNYFMLKKNGLNFDKAVAYIKMHNPSARIEGKRTISGITFSDKLFAFSAQARMDYSFKGILDNISYVRNMSLHRTSEDQINLVVLKKNFEIALRKNRELRTKEEREAIKDFYTYKFIEDRDYDLITASIIEFKELIVDNL